MPKLTKMHRVAIILFLLPAAFAFNLSLNLGANGGSAATYLAEIGHEITPSSPGAPEVINDDTDTSITYSKKFAWGDSFRLGIFERPFSKEVMDYFPEVDLTTVQISKDENFYYFILEVAGPNKDTGALSATYGVEFDTDSNGRGDVLLFAQGNGSPNWTIEGVYVYADSNDDVGGLNPVIADANPGDGYDQLLFSIDAPNNTDGAWQKVDGNQIYLAVKRSLIGSNRFYWRVWADSGLADPSLFDYNDAFSEEQAGSANKNSKYYPVGQLNLMDSTCWMAYNLRPSGFERGGCYQVKPTPIPTPTPKPPVEIGYLPAGTNPVSTRDPNDVTQPVMTPATAEPPIPSIPPPK